MAKGKNVLGLDIGSSGVKICLLKDGRKGLSLVTFDHLPLPPEAIVDGTMMNSGAVVDTIKQLLTRNKLRVRETALSVSGHSVIIKKIPLPLMTDEELEQSIQWEAEQYIPFDINDVYLDVEVLNRNQGQGQMEVLLVAAKKEMINDYVNVAKEAGLMPMVVDVDAFCLQNMFEVNYGFEEEQTVVLLDVGSSTININVLSGGRTSFTRDVSMGGNQFTEEIQKQLNITYEEAETYKCGGDASDAVIPHEVEKVIQQVAEFIAGEVQRSLDFYAATTSDAPISRIYLSGGSCSIPALGRTISRVSGVPVELLNPFRKIESDGGKFNPQFLESVGPIAAVSVGLALRRTNEQ
jgi:type IV pilus assembly protein PilM